MNYSVNLSSGQTVEVVIGEAAQINVEQALNYIESGRVEITKYVNEWAKPEITNYTNEYAEPIVAEIVNQTTKPLIDDYLNTTTKPQIDEYVADNVKPYSDSAQDSAAKAKISEDNAKTSETNAKASELAAASSAGVASAAAVTATEAKDYTAKVLTDKNLNAVGQDLQSADSNIKTVATNILNVNTVAKNIDNVNLLAPHTEAMEALAPDIMDVVTVAGITEQTKNVSDNMTAVVDVSNNKTNINNVSVNMPFVEGVSDNITHVVAVDRNKANIDNVATNKTNINNVSANIAAVNNVSENMADVKEAVQSANDAKLWAIGTKTEKPEGSSKYWAEEAKNAVQTPDASETVKGIVRLATSDEVTAGTNDSAAITPLKFKQKIAQNLTNPSADTVPSTKAVSDESSHIVSIMNTKVNKSGDTMTGRLDFQNNYDLIWNITPAAGNTQISMVLGNTIDAAGSTLTNLATRKVVNGKEIYSVLQTFITADGQIGTSCPGCKFDNSILTNVTQGSNYVRFGNGLQICWGYYTGGNYNFPVPFKDANYMLSVTYQINAEGQSYSYAAKIRTKTNTYFECWIDANSNSNYIAIGYWY